METGVAFFVTLVALSSVLANAVLYMNTKWQADKSQEAHDYLARRLNRRR